MEILKMILVVIMLVSLGGCKGEKQQQCASAWQNEPIVADGLDNDWNGNIRYFDSVAKLQYDARNDSSNLYLIIETADPSMIMKLMHGGLKVSLALKSKPGTSAAITFPAGMGGPMMSPFPCTESHDSIHKKCPETDGAMMHGKAYEKHEGMKGSKCPNPCNESKDSVCHSPCKRMLGDKSVDIIPDTGSCMRHHMPNRVPVTAEGFVFTNGFLKPGNALQNTISFAVNMSNPMTLTYEVTIPLREIYGDGFEVSAIADNPISLSIDVKALGKQPVPGMGPETPVQPGVQPGEGVAAPDSAPKPCVRPCEHPCKVVSAPRGEGPMAGHPCERMNEAPHKGMGHPFMNPDTVLLQKEQKVTCRITLAGNN
jgi:hypothetical protein